MTMVLPAESVLILISSGRLVTPFSEDELVSVETTELLVLLLAELLSSAATAVTPAANKAVATKLVYKTFLAFIVKLLYISLR